MITTLTKEQKEKFKEYKKKYVDIGLSTKQISIDIEKPINDFYTEILKKDKPKKIIIARSPIEAWHAVCLYKYLNYVIKKSNRANKQYNKNKVWNEVRNEVWNGVGNEVEKEVRNGVREEVREEVWNEVEKEVRSEVWNEVREEVREEVRNEVENEVRNEVWNGVGDEVENEVRNEVGKEVGKEVRNEVWNEVRNEVRNEVENEVQNEVWKEVRNEVWNGVGDEIENEIRNEVGKEVKKGVEKEVLSEVWNKVQNEVWNEVRNEVRNEIENEIRNEVGKEVKKGVEKEVLSEVWNEVLSEVWNEVLSEVWNEVWNEVRNEVRNEIENEVRNEVENEVWKKAATKTYLLNYIVPYVQGKFDSFYFAFYDFMMYELKINYRNIKKYEIWKNLLQCEYVYPLKNICILSNNFIEIHRNENGQLHNENNPALKYEDGFSVYVLNGVRVPKWVVMTPAEKIEIEDIFKEQNVEIRRELVRKVGIERIYKMSNSKEIDSKGSYALIDIPLGDNITGRYLKMINPSIDTIHLECVPNQCETVDMALAWRNHQWEIGQKFNNYSEPIKLT